MATEKVIINARKINKIRCILGLVICLTVIALTIVSFNLNVLDFYNEGTPEAGLGTLKMYTTLSNILAALAASICVPFQIDGLRKNKYKLPKWVVEVMYIGAVGVSLTFTIAISLISINSGFVYAMFGKSNLFMHTINPLFIILLFTVAVSDGRIKFTHSFWTLIPTFIYACLYFVCVFVTKIWNDHYHVNDFVPWPVAFIMILVIAFGLSQLLRFLHNLTNKYVSKNIERYYKESPDYEFPKIKEAIAKLAKEDAIFYKEGDEISIPVDIIKLLSERYKTNSVPIDILYDIYLENYLLTIHPGYSKK